MGEDNKQGGETTAVDSGKGAVDDASNVHELFGRRPDKEGGTIAGRKQPNRRPSNPSPDDILTLLSDA